MGVPCLISTKGVGLTGVDNRKEGGILMNLLELSTAIGLSSDTLKAMIAKQFQVIVLSDHAQLREIGRASCRERV